MSFKNALHQNFLYILLALLVGWWFTAAKLGEPLALKVGLTIETAAANEGLQFYCHSNHIYTGKTMVLNKYSAENQVTPDEYKIVNDLKCDDTVTHLRFDPLPAAGKVIISAMRIHTRYWQDIDLDDAIKHIKPINSIQEVLLDDNKIIITAIGNDPYIELSNNMQSYMPVKAKDYLIFLLKFSFWAFLLIKLITLFLGWLLKNGLKIYQITQSVKNCFDLYAKKLTVITHKATSKPIPISSLLVLLGFAAFLVSCHIFTSHLSQTMNLGYFYLLTFTAIQFAFILAIYILSLGLLGQVKWLRILLGFIFLYSCLYIMADVSLFTLNGMHLSHGIGMLTDGGLSQFFNNLKFTQLSKAEISLYLVIIVASVMLSIVTVWLVELKFKRSHFNWSINQALIVVIATLLLLYLVQKLATKHLSQHQITTYENHHPLGMSFFDINDYLVSFNVQAKPFYRNDTAPLVKQSIEKNQVQNVYLFIFESLRADVVEHDATPNLIQFKNQSWQFEQAVASGNATHYGWFSIINARQPYFWERYTRLTDKKGSTPIQLFKQLGYNINVYSAKDLSYLQSNQTMFGQDLSLYDYISPHPAMSPPEHDRRTIDELLGDIESNHQKTKNLNIIFLDSSHYPYRWNAKAINEVKPYQGTPQEGTDLSHAKRIIKVDKAPIFNRYKNSIKYMDHLFGEMTAAINQFGLNENSVVVAVGDHGQQFMEHGYMLHGFTLFNEDIKVPLYFKGLNIPRKTSPIVASHVDILPTILDHIGVNPTPIKEIDGKSLLQTERNKYKLSSVAGEQNTPASFVLSSTKWKLYFRTERNNPLAFSKIFITQIADQNDTDYIPGNGLQSDYLTFIKEEFPGFLKQVKIFK